MSNPALSLDSLRRPRLLVRAARIGLDSYNRARDLRRVLPGTESRLSQRTLDALMTAEAEMEGARGAGDGRYSVTRHVDLLIALMAEARLMPRPAPSGVR
ncbi:DUF6477 family protein [Anianabacter salinae]|uniref:DUF6477 family protein n=1 Tax=Anianabacter salinae TaxID=2851023 RepID=UPI00225E4D0C|nr:DUF6477 family protein [Anianabacter salinae]MBV0912244.1 hypothetical protein [Anianabacter salinae]